MKGLVAFFKDIFTLSDDNAKVGLAQFKLNNEPKRMSATKVQTAQSEVKLSDLMRRSY